MEDSERKLSYFGPILIRLYHIALGISVIVGTLFAKTLLQNGILLASLLFIIVLQHKYNGCMLTPYERQDSYPSLSDILKNACTKDKKISTSEFETMAMMLLLFLVISRILCLVLADKNIIAFCMPSPASVAVFSSILFFYYLIL
jgi:hypothetical protein